MQGDIGHYEAVVVGGGAAGLSAAVVLARARRSVLVVDAGRPRNAPAEAVHSYLTRDGTAPAQFLAAGRDEVGRFGGQVRRARVERIERGRDRFTVHLDDRAAVEADRLLVATGLVDRLPPVPGLAERWGRDVLHCPYCHGWEVRDEPIAILATGSIATHQALMWRQWSDRITLLRHTAPEIGDHEAESLAARGIDVVDGEATGLAVEADRLRGVRLATGATVPCRALVVAPRFTASASLLTDLGLRTVDQTYDGEVIGTYVDADHTGATSVPGVWVAGNVTNVTAQVVGAAEAGVRAAAAVNADLTAAAERRAVAAYRQVPAS